ncbi:low-density lipoprotein receptor-like [Branchiostoma lanceolatum]|uniref:low-density lipoprotein receptor-like n=1 Tax=Branchiostoma lanceolatum TaxID=7740 RepID=UPI003455BA89
MKLEDLGCLKIDSQFSPCGDGDVYHDSQTCDGSEACSTGEDEAHCDECAMECLRDSGDPCIPRGWICDELDDCLDGRDERGCVLGVPKNCFFTCHNNVTCLPTSQLGDGHHDCSDGEDERPSDIEDALGRRWDSCSYNCASVYGNASCVPDAFRCDGDADCMEEEDEQGCERILPTTVDDCPTFYCSLPGSPDLTYCVQSHLICDGYPDCAAGEDEQGCGNADVMSTPAGTTLTIGLTAEPTSGQGSLEDQTELYAESHGSKDLAVIWITAAALGGQILYRLTF